MPSTAAVRAAEALVQVADYTGDRRLVTIAGSGVGTSHFQVWQSDAARSAHDAMVCVVARALCGFLLTEGATLADAELLALARERASVIVEMDQNLVTVCGVDLPGAETLGENVLRRRMLTRLLAEAFDAALERVRPPPSTKRTGPSDATITKAALAAERERAAMLERRIAELEAQLQLKEAR